MRPRALWFVLVKDFLRRELFSVFFFVPLAVLAPFGEALGPGALAMVLAPAIAWWGFKWEPVYEILPIPNRTLAVARWFLAVVPAQIAYACVRGAVCFLDAVSSGKNSFIPWRAFLHIKTAPPNLMDVPYAAVLGMGFGALFIFTAVREAEAKRSHTTRRAARLRSSPFLLIAGLAGLFLVPALSHDLFDIPRVAGVVIALFFVVLTALQMDRLARVISLEKEKEEKEDIETGSKKSPPPDTFPPREEVIRNVLRRHMWAAVTASTSSIAGFLLFIAVSGRMFSGATQLVVFILIVYVHNYFTYVDWFKSLRCLRPLPLSRLGLTLCLSLIPGTGVLAISVALLPTLLLGADLRLFGDMVWWSVMSYGLGLMYLAFVGKPWQEVRITEQGALVTLIGGVAPFVAIFAIWNSHLGITSPERLSLPLALMFPLFTVLLGLAAIYYVIGNSTFAYGRRSYIWEDEGT